MRFSPAFLEDVKARIPIADVVGRRVTFDRRKSNPSRGDFWACCPFHGEKTPSFHCENTKGRYHCFGCGVSGDHFRFLTELDGMSFPEAVERLAGEAGVPMPAFDPQEAERSEKRASLGDVMALAASFYQQQLQSAEGAEARAYLRKRGLSPAVQQAFGLGFSPNSRSVLKEFLGSKAIDSELIEACGLVVHGPDIPVSYDRFRGRIMFPILDVRERVIAFGGRAMSADVPAKYLNSPETDLFSKSNTLYNLAAARRALAKGESLIVVEGYMDVIALAAHGINNAVAPLGTALTENQLELAWRSGGEPVLCFDGDEAGLRAAFRSIETALPRLQPGRSLRFVLLPDDQDPDDVVRSSGAQVFRDLVKSALPLADLVWMRETQGQTFDTPERRADLEKNFSAIVSQIGDETVRRHYQQDIRERLNSFFGVPRRRQDNWQGDQRRQYKSTGGRIAMSESLMNSGLVRKRSGPPPLREAALAVTIVHHPAVGVEFFDEFAELDIVHPDLERLREVLLNVFAEAGQEGRQPTRDDMIDALQSANLNEAFAQFEKRVRENRIWQAMPDAAFEDARDGWRQAFELQRRSRQLVEELRNAEEQFAQLSDEASWERLVSIQQAIAEDGGLDALIDGFGLSSGRPMRGF